MNIIEFLQENDIEYWTEGKNVSSGYVNIACFFCGDSSNHLGIKLNNNAICNCWKCGPKRIIDIILEIKNCSIKEAKQILKSLDVTEPFHQQKAKPSKLVRKSVLPKEANDIFPAIHLKYLKNRGFNPRRLIRKYNLKACYLDGEYKFRIIIPIYQNKRLVSFTSRDVTNTQAIKYKTASLQESMIDPKEIIFNLDSVNEYGDAICVEGPFDVFKLGDGAFCFLGVKITPQRILEVAKKKINNLYIFYDNDDTGKRSSKNVAKLLSPVVKKIHILKFKEKYNRNFDPGKLSIEQAKTIKEGLNFK